MMIRRRIVSLWLVILIVLSLWCSPVYANGSTEDDERSYLVLGDSISTGLGLQDPQEQSFACLVAKKLGLTLVNKAVVSSTAEDTLHRLQRGGLDDAIEAASLITITCGGNDMMNVLYDEIAARYNEKNQTEYTGSDVFRTFEGRHSHLKALDLLPVAIGILPKLSELPQYKTQLENYRQTVFGKDGIIAYLRAINPTAVISISTQYNPYQSVGGIYKIINTSVDRGARELNQVIWEGARDAGCIVSDVYSAFAKRKNVNLCNCDFSLSEMNFDFHPNATGHTVIAQTVMESFLRTRAKCLGYQNGTNTIRLIGSVYNLEYDSFEVEVSYTDQNGQMRNEIHIVKNVHQRIYGNIRGTLSPILEGKGNTHYFTVLLSVLPMNGSAVSCKLHATSHGIDVLQKETVFIYQG